MWARGQGEISGPHDATLLANGNTLITNSDSGQVFEVTSDGKIVWEFINSHLDGEGRPATIVRMKRYDTGFVDMFLD